MTNEINNLKQFVNAVKQAESDEQARIVSNAADKLIEHSTFSNDDWIEAVCACLKNPKEDTLDAAETIVRSDCIDWRKAPEGVTKILDNLLKKPDLKDLESGDRDDDYYSICKQFHDVTERIVEKTISLPTTRKTSDAAFQLLQRAIKTEDPYYAAIASNAIKFVDWKDTNEDRNESLTKSLVEMYRRDTWYRQDPHLAFLPVAIQNLWEEMLPEIVPSGSSAKTLGHLYNLFDWLEQQDLTNDRGGLSPNGQTYSAIIAELLVANGNDAKALPHLLKFIPHAVEWTMQGGDLDVGAQQIQAQCQQFLNAVMSRAPQHLERHTETFLKLYMKNRSLWLLSAVESLYRGSSEARNVVHKYVNSLLEIIEKVDDKQQTIIMKIMELVSETVPKELQNQMDRFERLLGHKNADSSLVLSNIARMEPSLLEGRGNGYYEKVRKIRPDLSATITLQVFPHIAQLSQNEAERIVSLEQKEAEKQNQPNDLVQAVLQHWQQLAAVYPAILGKRTSYLTKLTKNPATADRAQNILDLLQGKTTPKSNEETDGISASTESNQLPPWSSEVARLLNTKKDNDWRLLAKRLNFNNKEVKSLGNESNPCMKLLTNFYNSRNASEATPFLVNILRQINRDDAVAVIERASKAGEPVELSAPIVIGYESEHARALNSQLQKDGFSSWLQTGIAPDNEEFDRAMESAQVLILCMDSSYVSSGNCLREANVAARLGKPIIPIHFEKLSFLPSGNLGSVIGDKNFIPFYDKKISGSQYEKLKEQLSRFVRPVSKTSRKSDTSRKRHSADSGKRQIRTALRRHNSDRGRRKSVSFWDEKPGSGNRKRYNIIISCSADKLFEMRQLEKQLREYGYTTRVVSYTEGIIHSLKCEVVIAALTLRYGQAKQVAEELKVVSNEGTSILPLLLDKLHYPPPVLMGVQKRPNPVDCTKMKSRSEWEDSAELDQIVTRLQSLASAKPNRPMRRERSLSNIPMSRNHVSSQNKPVPMEPLAREASEITIRLRPATPQKDGGSRIPLPAKGLDFDGDYDQSDEPYDSEDDQWSSSDEETTNAKQMQQQRKLPQLSNGRQEPETNRAPPKRQPAAVQPKVMSNNRQNNNQRKPYFDLDGPKLPSVYRKKFVSTQ